MKDMLVTEHIAAVPGTVCCKTKDKFTLSALNQTHRYIVANKDSIGNSLFLA